MKKIRIESIRLLFAASIICAAFAVAPIGPTGCAQYNPPTLSEQSTDQIILRAEQTAETAKLTFNTLVHLERDNEALLKQVNPNIHLWANNLRRNGIDWIQSLRTATKDFKVNRNTANQATLNTALLTLTNAINETNKYITQAKKVALP